ncbi:M14 family zinc carboxypeptidase [Thiomicrorhabdus sp.]|uniref:M14 family zinc carboxypeptidase n=1 Tax=Thiomicrorhabdus sp. TaxID=2039724 RepID=UPI0029C6F531|nr:M14 family zinc carboxypeptidase [Thiomicrorhabdus sp.]
MRQQYSSYQECVDFFKQAEKQMPHIFKVESIGKTWEERDIIAVTISCDVQRADEKPALFYTGTLHAREWIGIELAIAFARHVIDHIDYDPQLINLLERAAFYVIPCANPDGFEYSRNHFAFWRKNRRQNADGSFGVDLNRNFSIGFWATKETTSNVYSGPAPFSEPETQALKAFVESHPNITIALDYHSQGNVFFPAHNFIHEDAVDATDLNVLSANMAEEIRKVSGREYGVHMGKPPTRLISGSGREFYYSLGALALTVEVGSRNISDYVDIMTENIHENIPALMFALSEVPNYVKGDRLPRVENLIAFRVDEREVGLEWSYPDEEVFFEIYRSEHLKGYCQSSNRIGMTKDHKYVDRHIEPATRYYYFIRAVNKERRIKSPFAPVLGVKTEPLINMFAKELFPLRNEIGYVGEKTLKNREHFGVNSLFVGISEAKGICYGVASYSLATIPENALIHSAKISFYPMNRVPVQVERFGEWRGGILDERTVDDLSSFDDIQSGKVLGYVGAPTDSHKLSQGVWRTYHFARQERDLLEKALKRRKVLFRMQGPDSMPLDRASQLMQWDTGYGPFSGGLHFRPRLEVSYTLDDAKIELASQAEYTISKETVENHSLTVGFDAAGYRNFGCIEFDLTQVPDIDTTIISSAYLQLEADSVNSRSVQRFHVEMMKKNCELCDYGDLKSMEVVERIGYDVSVDDIKSHPKQRFIFDRYAIGEMVDAIRAGEKLLFVISSSAEKTIINNQSVTWIDCKRTFRPRLVINYIKKRRKAPERVSNLRYSFENEMIRLDWDNCDSEMRGVIVVKNPFHVPCNPYDGQKLYGGQDNYTYDNFGSKGVQKYYAVFAYDDVPNFSEASWIEYLPKT